MRALPPDFAAHLASGATTLATCWRIERRDGAVIGFTDHDRPLAFDGASFEPEGGAEGAALAASADLSVDNTEIVGAFASDRLSADDLSAGAYDGATVEIWRVNWASPATRLLLRRGRIGEVAREGGRFRAEIRGASAALDRTTGRLYQRQCDAVVGDARCGVDLDAPSYRGEGVVAAIAGEARFAATGLQNFAAGWFADGVIAWTSGANAGARALIRTHEKSAAGDTLALAATPGRAVAVGDAFVARAGCDRRAETCRAKFANFDNFRGFPFIPGDDAAISYPVRGERNDGGRR